MRKTTVKRSNSVSRSPGHGRGAVRVRGPRLAGEGPSPPRGLTCKMGPFVAIPQPDGAAPCPIRHPGPDRSRRARSPLRRQPRSRRRHRPGRPGRRPAPPDPWPRCRRPAPGRRTSPSASRSPRARETAGRSRRAGRADSATCPCRSTRGRSASGRAPAPGQGGQHRLPDRLRRELPGVGLPGGDRPATARSTSSTRSISASARGGSASSAA